MPSTKVLKDLALRLTGLGENSYTVIRTAVKEKKTISDEEALNYVIDDCLTRNKESYIYWLGEYCKQHKIADVLINKLLIKWNELSTFTKAFINKNILMK